MNNIDTVIIIERAISELRRGGKIVVTDRPITTLSIIIPIIFFFTIFGIALGLYMYFRRKGTSSTLVLDWSPFANY